MKGVLERVAGPRREEGNTAVGVVDDVETSAKIQRGSDVEGEKPSRGSEENLLW